MSFSRIGLILGLSRIDSHANERFFPDARLTLSRPENLQTYPPVFKNCFLYGLVMGDFAVSGLDVCPVGVLLMPLFGDFCA